MAVLVGGTLKARPRNRIGLNCLLAEFDAEFDAEFN